MIKRIKERICLFKIAKKSQNAESLTISWESYVASRENIDLKMCRIEI